MKGIEITNDAIYINGKREKIMSGAVHYFRVVPEYWYDRLLKLKELGCNCVETYVCWNLHEKREGEFDFGGWLDFGKFLEIANALGLYAIVRPGPYICSEWDFGGLPWWLLKYPEIELRCSQPLYLQKITPYLEKVCEILCTRQIGCGGNVIFVQIENEYGSFGNDKAYLEWLKNFYISHGIECGLLTSDGETEFLLHNGTLPDVLATVNYRRDSVRCLQSLQKYHGGQPGAVLELWNGKAQHWGEIIERRDICEVAKSLKTALENAELVNLYMFHGGTNFGFVNGALDFGSKLTVQLSSYDVDAPLSECGFRTPKYYAEQKVICKYFNKTVRNTAKDPVFKAYDIEYVGETALAEAKLGLKKLNSSTILSMEACDQGYGYIVYETDAFIGECGAELLLPEIHDIAHIYVDGAYVKTLERYSEDKKVLIPGKGMRRISIFVENMGRVNYGIRLKDRKGLIGDLNIHDLEYNVFAKLFNFTIYSMDLNELPVKFCGKAKRNEPSFYCYTFETSDPADTFLKTEGFTRGVVFINGFNLGRHWNIENSENKLYIPAPLLKKGKNTIIVFDVLANENCKSVKTAMNSNG